jgi:hypothetical protein
MYLAEGEIRRLCFPRKCNSPDLVHSLGPRVRHGPIIKLLIGWPSSHIHRGPEKRSLLDVAKCYIVYACRHKRLRGATEYISLAFISRQKSKIQFHIIAKVRLFSWVRHEKRIVPTTGPRLLPKKNFRKLCLYIQQYRPIITAQYHLSISFESHFSTDSLQSSVSSRSYFLFWYLVTNFFCFFLVSPLIPYVSQSLALTFRVLLISDVSMSRGGKQPIKDYISAENT